MTSMPEFDLNMLSDAWSDVSGSPEASELEAEIEREIVEGHRLHGSALRVVAARKLRKEIIVWSMDDDAWVWVHLTWAKESDPRWPSAEVYADWHSLVADLRDGSRG